MVPDLHFSTFLHKIMELCSERHGPLLNTHDCVQLPLLRKELSLSMNALFPPKEIKVVVSISKYEFN